MSYSRWTSKESWYCFWHVSDAKTANNEILSIWYTKDPATPNYTYEQLKKDREWVWWDIKSRCSPKDRETFDYCVDAFLEDVEAEYKLIDLVATNSGSDPDVLQSAKKPAQGPTGGKP